jgi:hypothetical protein
MDFTHLFPTVENLLVLVDYYSPYSEIDNHEEYYNMVPPPQCFPECSFRFNSNSIKNGGVVEYVQF